MPDIEPMPPYIPYRPVNVIWRCGHCLHDFTHEPRWVGKRPWCRKCWAKHMSKAKSKGTGADEKGVQDG